MRSPIALAAGVAGLCWPEPVLPTDPYMPVSEDNIYVVAEWATMGDWADTTSFTLKKAEVIDGMQYWVDDFGGLGHIALGKPFRVDEEDGSIWISHRPDSRIHADGNEIRRRFLRTLDLHPILMESLQDHALGNLPRAEGDLLIYDFDSPLRKWREDDDNTGSNGPPDCSYLRAYAGASKRADERGVVDYESWPAELLARALYREYLALLNEHLEFTVWPVVLEDHAEDSLGGRGYYVLYECHTWSERWFLPGVGLTWTAYHGHSTSSEMKSLVWALVDGEEWGEHPGPGYPGHGAAATVVTGAPWGSVKESEEK